MRVITGVARGIRLVTLEGLDTRPTTEKVKEAIFSSIHFEIPGKRILDLFAGSGQMGIEALSRGAASAVFVDANPKAVEIIRGNIERTKLLLHASVAACDAMEFLAHAKDTFDIVFLDPPYSKGLINKALPLLTAHMSHDGVIVCEAERDDELPATAGDFSKVSSRGYGKSTVSMYRTAVD